MRINTLCVLLLVFLLGFPMDSKSVNYSGNYNVGTIGTWTNLTNAFTDISAGTVTGNISLILVAGYPAAAETYPIAPSTNNGSYTITIYPGITGLSITSANATGTLNLNGCNNYIFDGRLNASGITRDLTISNTNAAGYAIQFISDASYNTITYCKVKGQATATGASGSVIFFSAGTVTGNDNNTIDNCDIDASGVCLAGIESIGSASPADNSGNSIQNSSIHDFYSATYSGAYGIFLSSGNTSWTIQGNSIFMSASYSYINDYGILINNASGTGFVVNNNYIGGSANNCTGTWTLTGAFDNEFTGIYVNVANTSAINIQGNVIKNINIASKPAASVCFVGIYVSAGYVNISGNTIGSATGTNSIILSYATNTGVVFSVGGINSWAVQGSVSNNTIGSITVGGGKSSNGGSIRGIECDGPLIADFSISGNLIGSTTTTSSIQYSPTSSTPVSIFGIFTGTDNAFTLTISDNTIQNLTNNTTGAAATDGIYNVSSSLSAITRNIIANLSTSAPATGAMIGIYAGNTTAGQTVSNNVIYNNINTNGTSAVDNVGIYYAGPVSGTNVVSGNNIYNLNLSSTSASAIIYGIRIVSGLATTSNNMICLGNGLATGYIIHGIYQSSATAANNYYYNSVYIGGVVGASGSNTNAFYSASATHTLKNNIFYNARTGGTGKHYAINVAAKTNLTSDYNDLYSSNSANLGSYNGGGTARTFIAWKAGAPVGDANSLNIDPSFVAPTAATPDIHISSASPVITEGTTVAGITIDYDNDVRSSNPDIGADEYHTNYYSKSTGNLDDRLNWGINTDGTGANPPDFITRNCTFNIRNNALPTIGAAWTVDAAVGNIIIIGDGTNPCNFTISDAFGFTGNINVSNNGTLTNQNTTNPTLNILDIGSTVNYNSADAVNQTVYAPITYGNLILSNSSGSGSSVKTTGANISIVGDLTVNGYTTFDIVTFKANRTGGGGTLSLAANSTLKLSGNTGGASTNNNFPNNFSTMTVNSSSTVEYYGATQTVYNIPTYGNLTITTAGNKTAGGNMSVAGNLLINTGTFVGSTFTINVAGNWTNNVAYTLNTSTVNFNGTAVQSIGGSVATTFYKLTINNTFATADQITLNSNVTVNNTLTLTEGIVNPNGNTFLLAADATANLGSANSYIDGPLNYNKASAAESALNFPVGKGTSWNPFTLTPTHTNATSVTYTGEVINSSPMALGFSFPGTIDHVSYVRYWQIDRQAVANLTNATIQVYYNASDGVTDYDNLNIAKTTGEISPWIDLGGSNQVDGFGLPTGYVTSGTFTSFSKFSLANKVPGTNLLPVELLFFDASLSNNLTVLHWATLTEINNDYFDIQKSDDLNFWKTIGSVHGAGNSSSLVNYSFIDKEPLTKITYYRLRQVDFDGQYEYSNIEAVSPDGTTVLKDIKSVYDANSDNIIVNFTSPPGMKYSLKITDITGMMVYTESGINETMHKNITIPASSLRQGMYIVSVFCDNAMLTNKLIIVR